MIIRFISCLQMRQHAERARHAVLFQRMNSIKGKQYRSHRAPRPAPGTKRRWEDEHLQVQSYLKVYQINKTPPVFENIRSF